MFIAYYSSTCIAYFEGKVFFQVLNSTQKGKGTKLKNKKPDQAKAKETTF